MSTFTDRIVEGWRWQSYWQFTRRRERIVVGIAARLPRWLKYRAFIDVAAEVTTSPEFRSRNVPEVTMVEVLQAYEVKR